MARSSFRSKRKASGGRYKASRKKSVRELLGVPALTKIGKEKTKVKSTRGGHSKGAVLVGEVANVYDPKSKKYVKAKIESVVENSANRHFVRRNILTKGAIIKTDKGNALVKGRPGQEGNINAVLVS